MWNYKGLKDGAMQAEYCKKLLDVSRGHLLNVAIENASVVQNDGYEIDGQFVSLKEALTEMCIEFPPDKSLSPIKTQPNSITNVQIRNETTELVARDLTGQGHRPLVLNFANGHTAGGGYLRGARAQEETLCYASTLYETIKDSPMYKFHSRWNNDVTDYALVSKTWVFRNETYDLLMEPWQMDVITCAAPIVYGSTSEKDAANLMDSRIHRVLHIAHHLGYSSLVLGAWGCGAFRNNPVLISEIFRKHLEHSFAGCFEEVVFAIADWSPERRFLAPFHKAFS